FATTVFLRAAERFFLCGVALLLLFAATRLFVEDFAAAERRAAGFLARVVRLVVVDGIIKLLILPDFLFMFFEILYLSFVFKCLFLSVKGAKISTFISLRILGSRINTVFS